MKKVLTFVVVIAALFGFFNAVVNAAIEEDRNNAVKISLNAIHMAKQNTVFRVACYVADGSMVKTTHTGVDSSLLAKANSGECYVTF